jgi:putative transposase
MRNPLKHFKTSPEIIRLAVMMYVRFPLSLRNVEDLLHERGINITHETVRFWWNRFGPLFARSIRKRRVLDGQYSNWAWHLDEVFVRINGELRYLWRAVDQSSIHSHFNLERHFHRRDEFKKNRTQALAEWRQLTATA